MKKKIYLVLLLGGLCSSSIAKGYLISTPNAPLLITVVLGERSKFQYYGSRVEERDIQGVYDSGQAFGVESYPVFGLNTSGERAMAVAHANGNMSLDLAVEEVRQYEGAGAQTTEIRMKDSVYPSILKQYLKAYKGTGVTFTRVKVENVGKKPVTLYRSVSAFLPVPRGDNWMAHFHGYWGAERTMDEEKLTNGQKVISNKDGPANAEMDDPSSMLSMDGKAQEEYGHVLGGALAWSGAYLVKTDARNTILNVFVGMNEETSRYILESKGRFVTPELAMTYSTTDRGGASRTFYRWARQYKLNQGNVLRDILLNSWEGIYFKVNQKGMDEMMEAFSAMGGELFVMDDGWFDDKYPRDGGNSSLGDWMVCKKKLPEGIEGLLRSAKKHAVKFGIWIEPEMVNTKSELFEDHPDWIMRAKGRPLSIGRRKTRVVLDLINSEVQDFVFGVVDNLMTKHPEIAYMKWDDNSSLLDYGLLYLSKNK